MGAPEGWAEKRLGEVAFLQRGFDLPERKRVEGNVPIISSSGISGYHNECQVKGPGVVTGRYGTVGEVFFIQGDFWPLNTSLWVKEFYGNDRKYVYYLLSKVDYKKFSDKTGVPGVNRNDLHTIKVPVPPKSEQQKIARILSTWDKAIATTEKLIENSKAQKKALMQQLLTGKRRLPGFLGEWRKTTIKQMGRVVSGGTPDTQMPDYWNGNILWTTPTDITALSTRYISNTARKITRKGVQASSASLLPAGTLLVCTRATVGSLAIAEREITTNQGFKSLVPTPEFDSDFLYYLFSYHARQFVRFACGSTFLELSKKDFERQAFLVPLLNEQKQIARILTKNDRELFNLQETRERLTTEKTALMQQLLTGKRRVNTSGFCEPDLRGGQ